MSSHRARLLRIAWLISALPLLTVRASPAADGWNKANENSPARTDLYGDPLPEGASARLGTVRLRNEGDVHSVAFSPDGKMLASANEKIHLWEVATGREVRRLGGGHGWGTVVAFSPDGKVLAAGNRDQTIRLYDVATGQEARQFGRAPGAVSCIAFSPDGKTLASGDHSGSTLLWDVATGREQHELRGASAIYAVSFAPDGKSVISAGRDDTLRLWEAATGKEIRRFSGHRTHVMSAAFSPDGKALVSADYSGVIRLWDVATGQERHRFQERSSVYSAAFSPDGRTLAWGGPNDSICLWDVAPWKELRRLAGRQVDRNGFLAFSPDGRTLAAWTAMPGIRLWDVATGKERYPAGHRSGIYRLKVSPDDKTVVSVGGEGTVRRWELASGKELSAQENLWTGGADLTPDPRVVVGWDPDRRTLRFREIATGKEIAPEGLQRRMAGLEIMSLAFSADGKTLVTGEHHTGMIRLWDLATGRELLHIQMDRLRLLAVVLSPDGKLVAMAGGWGEPTRVWDAATGKEVRQFPHHPHQPRFVTFSPDSKVLAVATDEGLHLWEMATGKEVPSFQGKRIRAVMCGAFSPDGRMLATGSYDRDVQLWELATGKERRTFRGHQGGITSLAFSGDGRMLISGSGDTTALVWDVTGLAREGRLPAIRLEPKELEARWTDLAGEDVSQAHRAIWSLVASAEQSVQFLRERVRPVPLGPPQEIGRLLADLDSDQFAVREKATVELEKLGEAAEPALRKALEGRPTPEVRRRVEQVLASLEGVKLSERLRALRAIETLEQIGTPEARQVLGALAKGSSEARLTQEAKASLERLARRPAGVP